ncbi:cupin domain-containing protein [Natronolimnobius sp. AArcel1]|uniref:cupin domain-containing protein n=1 Tax=Natronolimnobius sp. AArcel1 TaxID=1679093 RepID=UPI0013EBAEE3|nr:cupin domain-containing protein [Natronolimnobius sp. AArcel1]NGM68216.1 cupin domain-containing protein [Natronolimnobius sp. AArcel1]
MGYETAAKTDPDSVVPAEAGGMWFLKDELKAESVGFTLLELEPGTEGMEHDETETGQEEIYYVLEGEIDVALTDADETVTLEAEEAIRLDPAETRQLVNSGTDTAKLVLVGGPL